MIQNQKQDQKNLADDLQKLLENPPHNAECDHKHQMSAVMKKDAGCQVDDSLAEHLHSLQKEKVQLESKLDDKHKLQRELMIGTVLASDKSVQKYTGIPSKSLFEGTFSILMENQPVKKKHGPDRKLSPKEEFVLTLMRLRLGLLGFVLADLFGVSESRVSQVFVTWIQYLSIALAPLRKWPSQRKVQKNLPDQFRKEYPHTRAIIDCTEFFVQKPRKNSKAQSTTYSMYKSHNTFKCLLSIGPTGVFTFVSPLYGGNISDRCITERSGFIDMCEQGDDIMADRGFVIRDLLLKRGATLNIPPFTRKVTWGSKKALTPREVKQTRSIARLRIHVERAIQRLKNFRLLSQVIPLTLAGTVEPMVLTAASLCNMQPPLVK